MKNLKTEKSNESGFNIIEFSQYKNVECQYTCQFIKNSRCVKIRESENEVTVAVAKSKLDTIKLLAQVHEPKRIRHVIVNDSDFAEFIGNFVDNTAEGFSCRKETDSEYRLEDISGEAPAVNIINAICLEAIRRGASDIHIQGTKDSVNIRLRIDGVLQTVRVFNKGIFDTLASRIKIMSGLNVMENRLCQDGRMSVQAGGKNLDFRVSIVPSVAGQNIVLRLFNNEKEDLSLEALGFSKENLSKIKTVLKSPHGMILATGPTGSGKTTTLHALLKEMDDEHLKIVAIEDPVEKVISGIEQIQVNDEIGLTFESVLRRILRHDPDVIMVGEIRDKETAQLAVRASLTGHLILSTLHTNDSISAVSRLRNLGIEPYLIAGTLKTVIAQRLVRKTCVPCKGKGCEECSFTGYKGRTAASEVFFLDDNLRAMIEKNKPETELKKYLIKQGFKTLKEDAALKIKSGISTKEEIMREGLL
ncbi:GspE/PulE family protein [uncultured Treponema sp.]|uniref:GspE/PulE family protein n=1 Tax=uncultured Treponema sp. TaxID=162155 RepID=UPI0025E69571|nr:GspE/PulE family protein [uncultured Treponema sp.]